MGASPAPVPLPEKPSAAEVPSPSEVFEAEYYSLSEFNGPIPPPSVLEAYERISPGLAQSLVASADKEAEHRRRMEEKMVSAQVRDNELDHASCKRGQICATVITLAALFAGAYTALHGFQIAGSVLGVGGIGGIVTTFILGRRGNEDRPPKTEDEPKPEAAKPDQNKRKRNKKA